MNNIERDAFRAYVEALTRGTRTPWTVELPTDPSADLIVRIDALGEPRTPLMLRADVVLALDASITFDEAKVAVIERFAGRLAPDQYLVEI